MDTRCEDLPSGGGASVAINFRRRRRDARSLGSSTMIRPRIAGVLARVFIAVALLTSGVSVLAAEKWMTLGGLRVAVWSLPAEGKPAKGGPFCRLSPKIYLTASELLLFSL